jgi:hypothetical protein
MAEKAPKAARRGLFSEYVYFFRTYRMWWLVPVIAVTAILGTVVMLGGSKAALLIYALF